MIKYRTDGSLGISFWIPRNLRILCRAETYDDDFDNLHYLTCVSEHFALSFSSASNILHVPFLCVIKAYST